jgi:phosphoribosylformylglycinamidine synthase
MAEGHDILLVGGTPGWLGRSAWLAVVAGRDEGAPPPVDLDAERRNGAFVLGLIEGGRAGAVQDLSDGGLGVALAEMALARGIGATVALDGPEHCVFFGEDQGRYVVAAAPEAAAAVMAAARSAGVACARIGVTGGDALTLGRSPPVALAALAKAYESWLPRLMEPSRGPDA